MTRHDADVRELASALGLGAFPYRSFRNPPVRRAPLAASPAAEVPSSGEEGAKVAAIADVELAREATARRDMNHPGFAGGSDP